MVSLLSFENAWLNVNTELKVSNKIILKYTSLILLFSVLKGVFMYFMRQTIIVVSRNIEFDLKNEIFQKSHTQK